METLLMSVSYLSDAAELLTVWDMGLEGNPYLLVNINIGVDLGGLCVWFWGGESVIFFFFS